MALLLRKIFCFIFLLLSKHGIAVLGENYYISDNCYNHKWSGVNFLKNVVHQSICEPYNATESKDKLSLINFEVFFFNF